MTENGIPLTGGGGGGGGYDSTSSWGRGGGGAIGGSGGAGGGDPFGMQKLQLAMQQLQEQQREFNVGQQAQQTSAQQAATGVTNLVNEYNQAYAQSVNEYTQRYNQMIGLVDSTSGQQAADIRSQYQNQASAGMQNLQRLGMGNTTLGSNMKLGVQGQQSAALNRLADMMNQTKLGVMQGKKSMNDLAPDKSLLLAALSQGGGAAGAYGGQITQALGGLDLGTSFGNPSQEVHQDVPAAGASYSSVGPHPNNQLF
jgi:hypothetical protein